MHHCSILGQRLPQRHFIGQRLSLIFAFPSSKHTMLTAAVRSSITRGARCAHTAASQVPKPRGTSTVDTIQLVY